MLKVRFSLDLEESSFVKEHDKSKKFHEIFCFV